MFVIFRQNFKPQNFQNRTFNFFFFEKTIFFLRCIVGACRELLTNVELLLQCPSSSIMQLVLANLKYFT